MTEKREITTTLEEDLQTVEMLADQLSNIATSLQHTGVHLLAAVTCGKTAEEYGQATTAYTVATASNVLADMISGIFEACPETEAMVAIRQVYKDKENSLN